MNEHPNGRLRLLRLVYVAYFCVIGAPECMYRAPIHFDALCKARIIKLKLPRQNR